jgi:hypothetical protein
MAPSTYRFKTSAASTSPASASPSEYAGIRSERSQWPARPARPFLLIFALTFACAPVRHPAPPDSPSAEIVLRDWGLTRAEEIGYASVSLFTSPGSRRLVVHDVRARPPRVERDVAPSRSVPPELTDGAYVISHFDAGNYNRLGGTFSTFSSSGQPGIAALDPRQRHLRVDLSATGAGTSGLWIHLYEDRAAVKDRAYLDATAVNFLTFEIRGERGNENLELRIADRNHDEREDNVAIAAVGEFLPAGKIRRRWQRAVVPLERLPAAIARHELATLVLTTRTPGRARVHLRNLALTADESTSLPAARPRTVSQRRLRRALWVWSTTEILQSARSEDQLVAFCQARGIDHVFLQLPGRPHQLRRLSDLTPMAGLLGKLHRVGVAVDALDGSPALALTENRREVDATVGAVIAYNRGHNSAERFAGLRFDNEPYLLPGYAGPRRASILRQYVATLRDIKPRLHRAGLQLGADIPFWFDRKNRFGEPVAELDGRPVSAAVLSIVDNAAIMAYRSRVYGPDGIIAHVLDELDLADGARAEIYVAVETVALPDEELLDFEAGAPTAGPALTVSPLPAGRARLQWRAPGDRTGPGARESVMGFTYKASAPAEKLGFRGSSRAVIEDTLDAVRDELAAHPSLAGFAVHSYESYRTFPE